MLGKQVVSPVVRALESLDPGFVPASRSRCDERTSVGCQTISHILRCHGTERNFTLDSWQPNPVWLGSEWLLAAILEGGGQFAPIGEGLRDDVGLMRAGREGA